MTDRLPIRDERHEALAVFLGDWEAEGVSYGGPNQSSHDPKAHGVPWKSKHTGRWHTGEFFIVQDERAIVGDAMAFDTLSVMGADPQTDACFLRSFENHGFYRHYELSVDRLVWTIAGATERARIEFRDKNRTQVITWEWKPAGAWLPLCDRIALRTH